MDTGEGFGFSGLVRSALVFVSLVLGLAGCGQTLQAPAPQVPEPPRSALVSAPPPPSSGRTDRAEFIVHVADVGTGLAVFVEGADFTLVYDAGSNDDLATGAGDRFTAYLHAVRPDLRKIDHVILSLRIATTSSCSRT